LNKRPLPSIQEFVGDYADKGAAHQGTALTQADDLFSGNGVHEFQEISIEIGIASFVETL
jgi:hypothetical protein